MEEDQSKDSEDVEGNKLYTIGVFGQTKTFCTSYAKKIHSLHVGGEYFLVGVLSSQISKVGENEA